MSDDDSGADAPRQHRNLVVPWKPGQSGNPAGRKKGERWRICDKFLQDFYEAWEVFGKPALVATAWLEPATFVKVAANLLPKEFKIEHTSELTDDQRRARIRALAEQLGVAAILGVDGRVPETDRGGEPERTAH